MKTYCYFVYQVVFYFAIYQKFVDSKYRLNKTKIYNCHILLHYRINYKRLGGLHSLGNQH
jgi:hypothetical protein